MKKILSLILVSVTFYAKSQIIAPDVISPGGDFFTATNFTNSYTVGEISIIDTYTGTNFILTQGFQQPDTTFITARNNPSITDLVFQLYPNPANAQINLMVKTEYAGELEVQVYDILSQQISTRKITTINGVNSFTFDISYYANGIYFMNIGTPSNSNEKGLTFTSLKFIVSK